MTSERAERRPTVTLLCGPTAAGKTTTAAALVDRGALRLSMDEAQWDAGWHHGTAPREVLERLYAELVDQAASAIRSGRDVVVDLSLASREVRDEWRALVAEAGGRSELVVLTAPIEVLWQRMQTRASRSDANAVLLTREQLERYLAGFEWPTAEERPRWIHTG